MAKRLDNKFQFVDVGRQESAINLYNRPPVEIVGNGKVEGVKLVEIQLGEPDEAGRRRPQIIDDSETVLEADVVWL